MNVAVADSAQITLRYLSDDERRRVWAWIDTLRNWETDDFVRTHSKKLNATENDYVLLTSSDVRIFFTLGQDTITVLDIAKKSTIVSSGPALGA